LDFFITPIPNSGQDLRSLIMRTCLLFSLLSLGAALTAKNTERKPADKTAYFTTEESNYALTNGKPVFYQIVMGSFPFRKQYKLWLASLRQVGKYEGTVVIVTDKPGCIQSGLGENLLGGNMTYTDENVDVFPGVAGKGQIHILKVKKAQSVRSIKMHKSRVWTNLKAAKIEHPVSSAIYTDTDVVIGKDLRSWLSYERSLEKKGHTLALFPDPGGAAGEGGLAAAASGGSVHTGVVVMFPTKDSQACLKEWGDQVGGGSEDPTPLHHFSLLESEESSEKSSGVDQQALSNCKTCSNHGQGILRMPKQYLTLPDENSVRNGKTAQFIHFTNTARWKTIDDKIKKKFFYHNLKISRDTDYDTKGACTQELWNTDEYRLRNNIKEEKPKPGAALKTGKAKSGKFHKTPAFGR